MFFPVLQQKGVVLMSGIYMFYSIIYMNQWKLDIECLNETSERS